MLWTCVEWHVVGTATKNSVNLYMNGTEVPGTAASATATAAFSVATLIKQRIGYERYAAGAAGDMWIDDYAIGAARIPCQ
jgi:hypothetical protein